MVQAQAAGGAGDQGVKVKESWSFKLQASITVMKFWKS